jgi:hypothetical protein
MLHVQFHAIFHIIPNYGSYIAAWTIGLELHSLNTQFHHTLYTGREEEVCSFVASGLVKMCDQDFYFLRDVHEGTGQSFFVTEVCLSGKLLLALTSTVIHGFESHGTHDHILLSQI